MKQAEIAKAAGVSRSYISRLLSGDRRNPSRRVLRRLAQALNLSLEELDRILGEPATGRKDQPDHGEPA